jgi:hypothetical protein
VLAARGARAQACCAGGNALTPGRLPEEEWLLFGLQTIARPNMGSFDARGRWVGRPGYAQELDVEWDAYGSWRTPYKRLQATVLAPFVLTTRAVRGDSAAAFGFGDLNVALRLDALDPKGAVPGVAVLAGATFPTGVAPESATSHLAVDATGQGTFRGTFGPAFEWRTRGPWVFDVIALATLHAPRTVGGYEQVRAPGVIGTVAATYVFERGTSVGAHVSYSVEWDSFINGKAVSDSGRRVLRVGLFGLHPLGKGFRLQGGVTIDPPIPYLGQNESANAALTLGLQRGFE